MFSIQKDELRDGRATHGEVDHPTPRVPSSGHFEMHTFMQKAVQENDDDAKYFKWVAVKTSMKKESLDVRHISRAYIESHKK